MHHCCTAQLQSSYSIAGPGAHKENPSGKMQQSLSRSLRTTTQHACVGLNSRRPVIPRPLGCSTLWQGNPCLHRHPQDPLHRVCASASDNQQPTGQKQDESPLNWDLDWFHYLPWWASKPVVLLAGSSFIIGSNLATSPSLKTTIIAAVPVAVLWMIYFWVVPTQFKDFAKQYINTHPECEEHARESMQKDDEQQQQQEEAQKQQQH